MSKNFDDLVQFVTDFLQKNFKKNTADITLLRQNYSPEELKNKISLEISKKGLSNKELQNLIIQVVDHSVILDHPFFMNQMFGKTQPIAFLADIIMSQLNTSMYTYEVAPVMTLIEKEMVTKLGEKAWGKGIGDGVFTAGGSISNMNALFLARQQYNESIKQQGLYNQKPFSIFISDQAHYSFVKGVNYLGFGVEALVKVPSNKQAKIDTQLLKKAITKSKKAGRIPLMLIGIAGTTVSGSFDDLETLATIAKENNMWFHVDAAFGGSFLFSEKLKFRLKGIEKSDSITWNFHKVMGMTLSTASFLTREKGQLNDAFSVDADYLFHKNDYDYDLGQKSLQGGRKPDAFKLWLSWKYEGDKGFETHVEKLHNAALTMADIIKTTKDLELFETPESSIVCFRYKQKDKSLDEINEFNKKIRTSMFEEGKIIFNYSYLHDIVYLRCVLLDPAFTKKQLQYIVTTVVNKASSFLQVEKEL